jgi:hypothetical protein
VYLIFRAGKLKEGSPYAFIEAPGRAAVFELYCDMTLVGWNSVTGGDVNF